MVAALVAAEGLVRLVAPVSEPRRHFRPGLYRADPELGWLLQPGYRGVYLEHASAVPTTTNEQGFRGPEWDAARQAAPVRVLVLGDSCTFGRGVADAETLPAQVEAILRARGLDAAVFNAGVPGYDTRQQRILFERLAALADPHVVIVAWLRNDVVDSARVIAAHRVVDGQLIEDLEEYREWRRRIDHRGLYGSALYRLVRTRTKLLRERLRGRPAWDEEERRLGPEDLARSERELLAIAAAARRRGASLVLTILPREEEVEDPAADTAHHDHLAEFARRHGVAFVDPLPAWRERGDVRDLYLPSDTVHLTAAGYGELAARLAALPVFDGR